MNQDTDTPRSVFDKTPEISRIAGSATFRIHPARSHASADPATWSRPDTTSVMHDVDAADPMRKAGSAGKAASDIDLDLSRSPSRRQTVGGIEDVTFRDVPSRHEIAARREAQEAAAANEPARRATAQATASPAGGANESWATSTFGDFASVGQYPVVNRVDDVVLHTAVLTHGYQPVLWLTQQAQQLLAVISLSETQVAWLLHENATIGRGGPNEVGSHMRQLMGKLEGMGMSVSTEPIRVTGRVFDDIVRSRGETTTSRLTSTIGLQWSAVIKQVLDMGGTDLHFHFDGPRATLRVRVDGELVPMGGAVGATMTSTRAMDLITSSFNNTKTRGATTYQANQGREWIEDFVIGSVRGELRCTSIPGSGDSNPSVAIRVLRSDQRSIPMESAGFVGDQLSEWLAAGRVKSGLVLVSGPMGSGKTTTTDSFLHGLHNGTLRKILAIEDPIEIPARGLVHKVPLKRSVADPDQAKKAYLETMSLVLRSDAQVVAVGEIRDRASGSVVEQLTKVNALVVSTLHVQSVSMMVPRLTDPEVGLTRSSLSATGVLQLLVCQTLLPKLCPHCKLRLQNPPSEVPEGFAEELEGVIGRLYSLDHVSWRNPQGCGRCRHRGVMGRQVVAEMWHPDSVWLDLTRQGDDHGAETYRRSLSDGNVLSDRMRGKTIFEHALRQVLLGIVSPDELERFHRLADYVPTGGV